MNYALADQLRPSRQRLQPKAGEIACDFFCSCSKSESAAKGRTRELSCTAAEKQRDSEETAAEQRRKLQGISGERRREHDCVRDVATSVGHAQYVNISRTFQAPHAKFLSGGVVGKVVALIVAISRAVFASAPAVLGTIRDFVGDHAISFAPAAAIQLASAGTILAYRNA